MTKREALQILMAAAGHYCRGAGQGLSRTPSPQERQQLLDAARKLWTDAYSYDYDEQTARNLGLLI